MKNAVFLGLVLILTCLPSAKPFNTEHSASEITAPGDSILKVGEELIYNASYGGFNIGQLRFKIVDSFVEHHERNFHARGLIDSYKGVPFVDVHTVYEDQISAGSYSNWFSSRTKKGNVWVRRTYRFDYPHDKLYIDHGIWKKPGVTHIDTVRIDTLYQDGLSLLYFARQHMIPGAHFSIPSYVSEQGGMTILDVLPDREHEKIDAVEYPIDLIHCKGKAGFVGVFGFSGEFEGWFSNDEARVPIIASAKVLIGTIRIELMKWNRDGWNPPRYTETDK